MEEGGKCLGQHPCLHQEEGGSITSLGGGRYQPGTINMGEEHLSCRHGECEHRQGLGGRHCIINICLASACMEEAMEHSLE